MKKLIFLAALLSGLWVAPAGAATFRISSYDRQGNVTWTNAFTNGVCTIEALSTLANHTTNTWSIQQSYFTTNLSGRGTVRTASSNQFLRLLNVVVSTNKPQGFTNLTQSYGLIHTIAGTGVGGTDGFNYWQSSFEGGYATNAALSRPHLAMGDDAGDVFIVDKDSHSVLKVTPDGRIHTAAGTHIPGNAPDATNRATSGGLFQPNGLWVLGNGMFYVLDTGNGKVRRVDTNGLMSTVFTVPGGIGTGRGLWVEEDESDIYFSDATAVKAWHATNGLTVLNTNFVDLGNLIATPENEAIYVTDRGGNQVWRVDSGGLNAGLATLVYGDGKTHAVVDGESALTGSLHGVRGIWRFPTGGFLLDMHAGNQVLYVDPGNRVHILVDGGTGTHAGDGQWFYTSGQKVTQSRSVSMDKQGNILIVENDFGYVRKIDFQRLTP